MIADDATPTAAPALLHDLVADAVARGAADATLELRPADAGAELRVWIRLPADEADHGPLTIWPVPDTVSAAALSTRDELLRLAGIRVVGDQPRSGVATVDVDGEPVEVHTAFTPTRSGGRMSLRMVRAARRR